jgi:subtilisin-like proprotein convertase family protein
MNSAPATKFVSKPKTTKDNTMSFPFEYDGCGLSIDKIEHVTLIITLTPNGKRGDLEMWIKSPMGTESMILGKRSHDYSGSGFSAYEFLTMELWDENPIGNWEFIVRTSNSKLGKIGRVLLVQK